MAIIATTKKEIVPDSNLLAGQPIRITKFKDNEVLLYNTLTKQWEADIIDKYTQAETDALIDLIPTATPLASEIDAADAKTPLVDTDTFPLTEPTTLKKTLWSTIKSTLKTYFDGLYLSLTGGAITGTTGLTITDTDTTTAGWRSTLLKLKNGTDTLLDFKRYKNGATDIFQMAGTTTAWLRIQDGWTRIDLTATSIFLNGILYPSNYVTLTRTGDASSTGTQKDSYHLNFQGSIWTGAAKQDRNARIWNKASTTVNNLSWLVLGIEDETTPFTIWEAICIKNTNGQVGINTKGCDKQLEINSADGNCLRLTYNDADGTATYYTDLNVSSAGLLTINASGGIINTANDIEITDATKGIILKSPDGSRWRVTVSDLGALVVTEI